MATNEATLLIKIKQIGTEILDRLVITAGDVVDAFKSVARFIGEAVEAYRENELATNKLTQAMINQGVYTQDLRAEYLKMADALQDVTTYGDEQIVNAQAILQSYSKNKKVTEELVRATLDLAAAKNLDLKTAAESVGKAISGETNTLARLKLEVNDNSSAGERYAAVLNKINSFSGQAEAAAKGLGAIDQAKNSWSDFLSMIGRESSGFVTGLAQMTKSTLDFFTALGGADPKKLSMPELNAEITKLRIELAKLEQSGTSLAFSERFLELKEELKELEKVRRDSLAEKNATDAKAVEDEKVARENKRTMSLEQDLLDQEQTINQQNMTMEQALTAQLALDNKKLEQATTNDQKMQALAEKSFTLDGLREAKKTAKQAEEDKKRVKDREDTLNTIATLQNSNNKALAFAGKAAAITQIAIETPVAISKALSAFPPPFNFAAAGLVGAAMAAQAARIAGVQLAEGGIVMPTPGGTQATIGEGGQAEAVIPLDRAGEFGLGGGTTIIFQGPIMGNESQAEEFARAIDRSLLKLRQSNQSVAFETDVI